MNCVCREIRIVILASYVYKALTSESQYIARMKSVTFNKHQSFNGTCFRYHSLPFDMPYHDHWNFCYHNWSLACTYCLDILLRSEVLSWSLRLPIVIS